MIKKILYGIGGIFALLILIGILAPKPEIKTADETKKEISDNIQTENLEIAENEKPSVSAVGKNNDEKIVSTEISSPEVTSSQHVYYPVVGVVDGDTVKINIDEEIKTFHLRRKIFLFRTGSA